MLGQAVSACSCARRSAPDAAAVRGRPDPCRDAGTRRGVLVQRGQRHDGRRCLRHRQQRHHVEHDVVGLREVRRRALLQRHERASQHPELVVAAADDGDDARGVGQPVGDDQQVAGRRSTKATTTTTSKERPTAPASRPAGGTFGGANANAYGAVALTANTWSYLALTYDGATLRLYVNGTLVGSQAKTGAITTSTNQLQIGGDSLYGQYFSGLIDEVRVYNVALSAGGHPDGHEHADLRCHRQHAAVCAGHPDGVGRERGRDRPLVGRCDRQRRRHGVPGRTLQRGRLQQLRADHHSSPEPPSTTPPSPPRPPTPTASGPRTPPATSVPTRTPRVEPLRRSTASRRRSRGLCR